MGVLTPAAVHPGGRHPRLLHITFLTVPPPTTRCARPSFIAICNVAC